MSNQASGSRGASAACALLGVVLIAAGLRSHQPRAEPGPAKHGAPLRTAGPAPKVPEAAAFSPAPPSAPAAAPGPAAPASRSERIYLDCAFEPPLRRLEDHYETWTLTPRELSWVLAHEHRVWVDDLQGEPANGGGFHLTYILPGSFASVRGLQVGDTLRGINGFEIHSVGDLENFAIEPANAGSRGLRVTLDRDGQELTLDYRAERTH